MARQAVVGVFAVLLVAASTGCGSNGGEQEATVAPTVTAIETPTAAIETPTAAIETPTAAPEPSIPDGAVTIINRDQSGSGEYRFDPSELTFKVGQEVTFALVAQTELHTFTVDELGINVFIDPGTTELFTFEFAKAGTYNLICTPHESLGMTGQIVVE